MAAVDYFLKLEGIEGESADSKHKGSIDIHSFSWGATNSGTGAFGGGSGAGKVSMQDFHFTMLMNKATPKLMLMCATGEHIKKAVLTCRKAGKEQQEYLVIKFFDCLVSGYNSSASEGGSVIPEESVSLNFSKVEFEYKPQKADGTLDGPIGSKYDLKLNKSY